MKRNPLPVLLTAVLLALANCSEPAPPAASDVPADPLTGTWAGTWGPSAQDRNDVKLELSWDGNTLTGVVNPGDSAVKLTKASFDPATGTVSLEADATGRGGAAIHYMVEGKLEGTTLTGSWNHDDRKGDFTLTKG